MGVSFSSLVENERTAKIDVNGERLHVIYSPRDLTGPKLEKFARAIADAHEEDDEDAVVYLAAERFCSIVRGWNLEGPLCDADGNEVVGLGDPVPCTVEYVRHVPGPVLDYLTERLIEDCRPNPQKRRA